MIVLKLIFAASLLTLPVLIAQAPPPATSTAPSSDQLSQVRKLGNDQLDAKNYDAAIATFKRLIPELSNPRDKGDIWARIADAYRLNGNLPMSTRAMEQAVMFRPDDGLMVTNLGLLYEMQGDRINARQTYERAIAISSQNPLALNNLAFLLADTNGDLDQALEYARSAHAIAPAANEVVDTIGWIYLKKGMTDDAIAEFRKVTQSAPKNPEYHYHYAMALNRSNNHADANIECQAALDLSPRADLKEKIKQECAAPVPSR